MNMTVSVDGYQRLAGTMAISIAEYNKLKAENERLTLALAKQTEQHEYPCSPHCAGYLREQAAQAENKQFRELLDEARGQLSGSEWPSDLAMAQKIADYFNAYPPVG